VAAMSAVVTRLAGTGRALDELSHRRMTRIAS
jgi:hypothetical protein